MLFGWAIIRGKLWNATLHRAAAGDNLAQGVREVVARAREDGGCSYLDKLDSLLDQHTVIASGDAEQMAEHVENNETRR